MDRPVSRGELGLAIGELRETIREARSEIKADMHAAVAPIVARLDILNGRTSLVERQVAAQDANLSHVQRQAHSTPCGMMSETRQQLATVSARVGIIAGMAGAGMAIAMQFLLTLLMGRG
jgi:hypothetical protein